VLKQIIILPLNQGQSIQSLATLLLLTIFYVLTLAKS